MKQCVAIELFTLDLSAVARAAWGEGGVDSASEIGGLSVSVSIVTRGLDFADCVPT